jgi:hypothetical protein
MRGLTSGKAERFRPVVEALEDRTVPTAFAAGNALTITGTNIVIIDTGSNSASNTAALTVTSDGIKQTFAGNITSIFINGNPGGDSVVYVLGGNTEGQTSNPTGPQFLTTRAQRTITTNLDSSARDAFTLWFQPGQTFVGANYRFNVNGGSKGDNYLVHSEGLTLDNSSLLALNLIGSRKSDNVAINMVNTDIGPSVSPGFAGETTPASGTAVGRGGLLYLGVFNQGSGSTLFADVDLTSDSQGFMVGDVEGGSSNNVVGLVVTRETFTPPNETVPTGFQQPLTLLQLVGGSGSNNRGIATYNVTTTAGLQTLLTVV